LKARWKYF